MCRLFFLLLCALLLAACAPLSGPPVADLRKLPQNPVAYVDPATADQPLLPPAQQAELAAGLRRRHFAPWQADVPPVPVEEVAWFLHWAAGERLHGENLRPLPPEWFIAQREQLALASYPALNQRALTVRPSSFRALPTDRPAYRDPALAGEGYPFDYLQMAIAQAGTPLLVLHRSADGGWLFAMSGHTAGWLRAVDIALVDDSAADAFATAPLAVLLRDQPVSDTSGVFRFDGRIGGLLPLVAETAAGLRVLLPVADTDGRALLREALLPSAAAAPFPLPFTPCRMAAVAAPLIGQPYGWGGLHGHRDCSSTLRDLFLPFGLWLPRNSTEQARAGNFIDLSFLETGEKERLIAAQGLPWRTLLWQPGHILLYLGTYEGTPVALHTVWGVRTRSLWAGEGRQLIGGTVITTLEPGRELWTLARPDGLLLYSLRGMVLLPATEPEN